MNKKNYKDDAGKDLSEFFEYEDDRDDFVEITILAIMMISFLAAFFLPWWLL